jgi:hypothetical protein
MAVPVWGVAAAAAGALWWLRRRRGRRRSTSGTQQWSFGPREGLPQLVFNDPRKRYISVTWTDDRIAAALYKRPDNQVELRVIDLRTDPPTRFVSEPFSTEAEDPRDAVLELKQHPFAPVRYEHVRKPISWSVIPDVGGGWQWVAQNGPVINSGRSADRFSATAMATEAIGAVA